MKKKLYFLVVLLGFGCALYINLFQPSEELLLMPVLMLVPVFISIGAKLTFRTTIRFEMIIWLMGLAAFFSWGIYEVPLDYIYYAMLCSGVFFVGSVLRDFLQEFENTKEIYPIKKIYTQSIQVGLLSLFMVTLMGFSLRSIMILTGTEMNQVALWPEIPYILLFLLATMIHLLKIRNQTLLRSVFGFLKEPIQYGTLVLAIISVWLLYRYSEYSQAIVYVPWPMIMFFGVARGIRKPILPAFFLSLVTWCFMLLPFLNSAISPLILTVLMLQLAVIQTGLSGILLWLMERINREIE